MPGETVIVVDDSAVIRAAVVEMLAPDGYLVLGAQHGEQALALLASGAKPDVIVLDLMMPVMGGHEFLQAARGTRLLDKTAIIVVSGGGSRDQSALSGLPVLAKPFTREQLLALVQAGRRAPS